MKPAKTPKKLGGTTRAFRETVEPSIDRANVMFVAPEDSRLYLSSTSRKKIVQKVEWCRQNFGIVAEWGRGIARHTVGKGIVPALNTPDKSWNEQATKALEAYLLSPSQCDVSGRRNAYEMQAHIVEQLVIVGEAFVLHSENPDFPSPQSGVGDCPAFYAIAPNDVDTPPGERKPTENPIHDGVELGDYGRAARYHVRLSPDKYTAYDARDVAHLFDAYGTHQSRGNSPLAAGVNSLVDIYELKRLETKTAKVQRMISLVLKGTRNQAGKGAFSRLTNDGDADAADTHAVEQLYQSAGAAIARMGADGDVQLITGKTPSPLVNEYVTDLLLRDAAATTGVPVEFFWSRDKLGGANARGIFAQADATFSLLADKLIYGWFEKLIIRFIEWRVASGLLPAPPEGWRESLSYRRPRRVTLDNGRDARARIEELNSGLTNLRSLYDEQGEDYRAQMAQWIAEFREFEQIAIAQGYTPEQAKALAMRWRPLPPGTALELQAQKPQQQQP
jgi:capsid protein